MSAPHDIVLKEQVIGTAGPLPSAPTPISFSGSLSFSTALELMHVMLVEDADDGGASKLVRSFLNHR